MELPLDLIVPLENELEPIARLGTYLKNVNNITEALDELAELVADKQPGWSSALPSCPSSPDVASSIDCCASCTSNWPARNLAQLSPGSVGAKSAPSSQSNSCASSSDFVCNSQISITSGSGLSPSGLSVASRRERNAHAAERYRRKLARRKSCLGGELEREETRNARLKRELEAKLVLYGEFADLLAQNTHDGHDFELATLGSRSVASIMELAGETSICQRARLARALDHFSFILHGQRAIERN